MPKNEPLRRFGQGIAEPKFRLPWAMQPGRPNLGSRRLYHDCVTVQIVNHRPVGTPHRFVDVSGNPGGSFKAVVVENDYAGTH